MPPIAVESPQWWLKRLEAKLVERQRYIELMTRYYTGDHPLPIPHDRAADHFRRLLQSSRANWTGMIVDAVAERLHVEGFRVEGDDADDDAWAIWQRNDLDADSELVHVEALVCGESYVSVWANPDDPETPLITPEHPSQMITDCQPGNRRQVAAALKMWKDDWTNQTHGTLYLPDGIYKYQRGEHGTTWQDRGPESEMANPLKAVPVVSFRNRPLLLAGGRSEIEDIIDIQSRCNKTLFDRMMASEYAAFRQRWATGMEIPLDDKGKPVEPFKAAVDRLWVSEDPATQFGEFGATDLAPYISAVESDVQHMSAISRTPPHYLLGQIVNISGDALKAAETGLSSKAKSKTRHFGESWERVIRLAFAVLNDPRSKVTNGQTIWADVETRTEGETVDALTKMKTLGVPNEALWERWGATPQEIDKWKDMAFEDALVAQAVNVTETTPPPVGQPAAGQPPPAPGATPPPPAPGVPKR